MAGIWVADNGGRILSSHLELLDDKLDVTMDGFYIGGSLPLPITAPSILCSALDRTYLWNRGMNTWEGNILAVH